ncbi:MAG: DASS family sodium-coupled anion symporter [Bifidobacteriaceae bacterium]|jgi:sodium-dependent dicarboxylate transporter 2/3/5|nr:DASS family sodium-coupled anion symporter [Bifidobacteriaceae bacterium]
MTTTETRTPELLPQADSGGVKRRYFGLTAGVVLAAITYFAIPADAARVASEAAGRMDDPFAAGPIKLVAALTVLMAVWWMTEAIPLAATSLIPIALFPVLSVTADFDMAGAPYASGTIFLFMGGFILALAMQRWNLHRRMALFVVDLVGTKPTRLIGGFMIATGFITMWVSNTATAVMMLPLGVSILGLVGQMAGTGAGGKGSGKASRAAGAVSQVVQTNFGTALMLGIAYASSIGSLSTLIGTPPNTVLRGYMSSTFGIEIPFGKWLLAGAPLSVVFLVFTWWMLTHVLFKPEIKDIPGGRELIKAERRALGPWSAGERWVAIVFALAALSWIFIPTVFASWGVKDEMIAMVMAVVLFLLPADLKKGVMVMDWHTAKNLPWDVLLLFGGGLSLSAAITSTGLSHYVGDRASGLGALPTPLLVVVVTAMIIFITELTSNTATANVFLPIMGGVAVGLGLDPMLLCVPVALAATCAFMLPVATPPNAVAYGSGYVSMGSMIKGGLWLNLAGIVLIVGAMYAAFIPLLNITLGR